MLSKYDVLDEIVKYLGYSDLTNLSLLNSTWTKVIENHMKKRLSPNIFCFTQNYSASDYNMCNYIKPMLGIVLVNPWKMSLKRYMCVHQDGAVQRKQGNFNGQYFECFQ